MKLRSLSFAVLSAALVPLQALAQAVPIDLNSWLETGPASNGVWTVSADGTSVTQSINGNPTFFVSPDSFVGTVLRGSIRVGGAGDDDYIGFVMGYTAPAGTGNDMNYVLLDWKQNDQSSGGFLAREGFALNRVNGTINDYLPGFWGHTDSPGFDVLGANFSTSNGWADSTTYSFEISYLADRVTVSLSGGAFAAPTTVLDVAGSFPTGRFGFYNYSQANVTYNGFTVEAAPPPIPAIPEPSTYALMLAGLGALAIAARRRRA